jgi:heat shock protein HslJ
MLQSAVATEVATAPASPARIHLSKTLAALLLIPVSLIALVGCSLSNSPLDGTRWGLDVWTLSYVSPRDFPITAEFADGRISGRSGVNTYNGPYKLGPGAAFSAGPFAVTQMVGSEQAMRTEAAYLTLLRQAKSFKMTHAKLTLYDEFGSESLNFEAASK